ncbi:SubName: Full=Uncharacterized protein {ECO:0000313/EMBL:CCA75215.1} [Serendipita indica DSM 11827]|nr:SubName: Full=Uncharacterized protein {ECO:0000313/EMBL:CCA75215.1} [Serendipita indica DSM 11827]
MSRFRILAQKIITRLVILLNIGLLVVTIFELVGLGRINWGVGMLPFLPVTMFGIGVLYLTRNHPPEAYAYRSKFSGSYRARVGSRVYVYYFFQMVVLAVKLYTLIRLKDPRSGTAFPKVDQVIAVLLMIVFLAILLVLTIIGMKLDDS